MDMYKMWLFWFVEQVRVLQNRPDDVCKLDTVFFPYAFLFYTTKNIQCNKSLTTDSQFHKTCVFFTFPQWSGMPLNYKQ
jgi:hypothetical protein